MVLDILKNLSLNKIHIIVQILNGFMMFFFISIFFTSVIINVKNRNLKSMGISLIFIIMYWLATLATFFGIDLFEKMRIELNSFNYYSFVGILEVIQIAMLVLIYCFADPFAREKKIQHMKETGEYDKFIRQKLEKKNKKKQMKLEKRNKKRKK